MRIRKWGVKLKLYSSPVIVVMLAKNPHFNPLIIMVHVNKMAGVYLWRTKEEALSGDVVITMPIQCLRLSCMYNV